MTHPLHQLVWLKGREQHERIAHDVASRPPELAAKPVQFTLDLGVEADGYRGCLHVLQCNTRPIRVQGTWLLT